MASPGLHARWAMRLIPRPENKDIDSFLIQGMLRTQGPGSTSLGHVEIL